MRVRFTNALLLSLGVFLGTNGAMAQSGADRSPSLLALPETGPQLSPLSPVSYNAYGAPTEDNSYGLTSSRRAGNDSIYHAPTDNEVLDAPAKSGSVPTGCGWESNSTAFEHPCCSNYAGNWFGSVGGLVMTRNHANPYWTSYQTNVNANQLMNTKDASAGWQGGEEFSIGHWFGCPCSCTPRTGIEFDFFTTNTMSGFSSITRAGSDISTPIDLGGVNIGAQTAGSFFDNAHEHAIWRTDECYNLELNLIQQQVRCGCGLNCTWLAGIRYFRFNETVNFGSASIGSNFGDAGGTDEAFLRFHVDNSLLGPQIGCKAEYFFGPKFGIYATPKIGIYGSDISTNVQLYRGDGLSVYNINGHKDDFSMLAQIDLVNYQITQHMRLYGGYRLIGVSQLALADNQFLPFLADTAGFAQVKSNGDLLLHGGMLGLEFNY